ncbi:MAG TPA: alpha-amylase family glycosyl hydrolase [Methylomusa anaerophila]|uniref:Neopullulanase n=1 Tax=Methylomusa anaerophila TaxID=1930071 RepID=A0A348AI51_9FIRM|nr:alpha-amylase family glycosyl hydrolase [Methylomusa anaerophila]BBB90749.1 neopullulanase [Methylomusa anaerophila]HML88648.1 alpha-amylase family glycosyl hydrolase [Methylomusa anaerophila]
MLWARDAFFYHIYPLGFCGAPRHNDYSLPATPRLLKILDWIQHIKELGVNALLLGPVFESGSHGYDIVDYQQIDRRLGDKGTFQQLTSRLHENGIRIVVDGVFNHVGRDFWAFKDVVKKGRQSEYVSWFDRVDFTAGSPYGDPFSYEGWEGHYNLVKLNLQNPAVKAYIFSAVKKWLDLYDIDGIRLDVAYCLDSSFIQELAALGKSVKRDLWLMGEVIHGDYNRWVNPSLLDSVTNYECFKGLYSSHNDKNYFEIAYSLNRQFGEKGLYKDLMLYNFADNNDVTRVGSILHNPAYLYPLHALLFTMPGIPSVYYGSEWGIAGKKGDGSDEDLRPALDLTVVSKNSPNKDLAKAIRRFAQIRKEHKALREGNYRQLLVRSRQYAFFRQTRDEAIVVIVNSSSQSAAVDLEIPVDGSMLLDLVNNGAKFPIRNRKAYIPLSPYWTRILEVRR